MSKLIDFHPYKDRFGLVQFDCASPGQFSNTSDNGAIMTVEYFLMLNEQERAHEEPLIKKALKSLEVDTNNGGVITRYPGSKSIDSMDNATALIVFSELFDGSRLTKKLYMHGELTRATYLDQTQDRHNNFKYYPIAWILNGFKAPRRFYSIRPDEWSLQSWWGRSPGFMGFLELAATNRSSLFRKFSLLIGQFLPIFEARTSTSNKKLSYLTWQWLKTRNIFWKLCYNIWCVLMLIPHRQGMKDVYKIYYGEHHPIARYSPKFL